MSVKIEPSSGPALVINLPAPAGATPLPNQATKVQLNADVTMTNGSLDTKPAKWTTSNTLIASVDGSGLVQAGTKTGDATITATSDDAKASGSVVVTVKSTGKVNLGLE
jgi:hypothetical protein